jgi:hypothetical protein
MTARDCGKMSKTEPAIQGFRTKFGGFGERKWNVRNDAAVLLIDLRCVRIWTILLVSKIQKLGLRVFECCRILITL